MAASDLIQLAEFKTWANIQSTNDDTLLSTLITQVSQEINSYLNRTLYQTTYTLVCDGKGQQRLTLPNWPVTAISAVVISGVTIPQSPDGIQSGWVMDPNGAQRLTLIGYTFTPGLSNVSITYTAGYTAFPADLVMAAKIVVTLRYRAKTVAGKDSATGPAGQSASYANKAEFPPEVVGVLNSYRRVSAW